MIWVPNGLIWGAFCRFVKFRELWLGVYRIPSLQIRHDILFTLEMDRAQHLFDPPKKGSLFCFQKFVVKLPDSVKDSGYSFQAQELDTVASLSNTEWFPFKEYCSIILLYHWLLLPRERCCCHGLLHCCASWMICFLLWVLYDRWSVSNDKSKS